ncbi:hypothetical protein vBValCWD615_39 [Vibrio phage vB_ValC_WD615]|nr:hypothetical protein vBValCWD615_39 [Vibrio phage vB_ValC_WD615]
MYTEPLNCTIVKDYSVEDFKQIKSIEEFIFSFDGVEYYTNQDIDSVGTLKSYIENYDLILVPSGGINTAIFVDYIQ